MWVLLNRYSRPPLAQRLRLRGAALNRRARRLVAAAPLTATDAAALGRTLAATAACWQVLGYGLPTSQRRRVKRLLQRQAPWLAQLHHLDAAPAGSLPELAQHARSKAERRSLKALVRRQARPAEWLPRRRDRRDMARLLDREAAWLADLEPPSEAALLAGLARLYRRARRAVADKPGSSRARRRLARLVRAEELIFAGPGPNNSVATMVARRRLLERLDQQAWLADVAEAAGGNGDDSSRASAAAPKRLGKLLAARRRALRAEIGAIAPLAFAEGADEYRRALPWRTFTALADAAAWQGANQQQGEWE